MMTDKVTSVKAKDKKESKRWEVGGRERERGVWGDDMCI